MSWLSGPCLTPGEEPSAQVVAMRADAERELTDWEQQVDPDAGWTSGAATWSAAEAERP